MLFILFLASTVLFIGSNGTVTSLPVFIPNILICVPKMTVSDNDKMFNLGWSNPLIINRN